MITVERKIRFRARRRATMDDRSGKGNSANVLRGRVPRVSRLMALAIRFDQMIHDGIVADQAELARLVACKSREVDADHEPTKPGAGHPGGVAVPSGDDKGARRGYGEGIAASRSGCRLERATAKVEASGWRGGVIAGNVATIVQHDMASCLQIGDAYQFHCVGLDDKSWHLMGCLPVSTHLRQHPRVSRKSGLNTIQGGTASPNLTVYASTADFDNGLSSNNFQNARGSDCSLNLR